MSDDILVEVGITDTISVEVQSVGRPGRDGQLAAEIDSWDGILGLENGIAVVVTLTQEMLDKELTNPASPASGWPGNFAPDTRLHGYASTASSPGVYTSCTITMVDSNLVLRVVAFEGDDPRYYVDTLYFGPVQVLPNGDFTVPMAYGNAWDVVSTSVMPSPYSLIRRDNQGRAQIATPAAAADIATKGYVDSQISGAGGSPTAFELRGTGFPEGAVTAPIGTYYTDVAATNGAIRWVKASGTGNTGWKVLYGDTGWRDVSSLCDPTVLGSGKVHVLKTPGRVTWRLMGPVLKAGTLMTSLPTGYRVDAPAWLAPAATVYRSGAPTSGVFSLGGSGSGLEVSGAFVPDASSVVYLDYVSLLPWPATLPGTPA